MIQVRALWEMQWYNLDVALKVGERRIFPFTEPQDPVPPGYDLKFECDFDPESDYRWATVEAIEHREFGVLDEVDTTKFGMYAFRFRDGRWVIIDTEHCHGVVKSASPDFEVGGIDPDRSTFPARRDHRWDLDVMLSDVVAATHGESMARHEQRRAEARKAQ